MRTNHKFPFAMTKKSLVVYIVFTVLMGLFLFFVRGDMVGKCAACIVCPMLSVYLIYAYFLMSIPFIFIALFYLPFRLFVTISASTFDTVLLAISSPSMYV